MSETQEYDFGGTDAPDNKEKVFVTPGYRRLAVVEFIYDKEEEGKTPLIVMKLAATDGDGNTMELDEKLYLSGKLNKSGVMSAVVRLQELYKGLTGDAKMTIKPSLYTYTKKELDGTSQSFSIPNPKEVTDFLNQKCKGKSAIFKVVGEESNGTVYAKLAYSGFLYYTDKKNALCTYREERDFTQEEAKRFITKKKEQEAPSHNAGIASTAELDNL